MIACKARFATHRLSIFIFVVCYADLRAQPYLHSRLAGFDHGVADYSQKLLSDKLRLLLFRVEFTVKQTGYANISGNLANLQIVTDFAAMAGGRVLQLLPPEVDRDLYRAERFAVRLYENLARLWEGLNPIPGLYYEVIIRSPAYPFIFMESVENYWWYFGTYPFTEDPLFRKTSIASRQFGFAFRILF
ncbi:MAG: hypothetical protein N2Z22_06480 [Turneriella sp.]|nr:hypothetical protein [Leptospiraceae bacterium]MCX7632958.1 hypothetical protein [Turneriella sp.]